MHGKRVLIGITGGIAAYKMAYVIRGFKKLGAEVRCIMTPASSDFISPLVVSTLSEHPVGIEFWDREDGTWENHVEYGLWADVFVVAPLTANTLSKMANGECDNLLLATYLSMKSKTIVAPAMDLDMYSHPTTLRNLEQLEKDGVSIIPAEDGELASGLTGTGRMAEPDTIIENTQAFLKTLGDPFYQDKIILVTAGPTHEAIDPVRFIGNHSSGKMGFAIADELARRGAKVILVAGPNNLNFRYDGIERIDVNSADEMLKAVQSHWSSCDAGVFAAAVADYRPADVADQKIKKNEEEMNIRLVKNPDILLWAGENKSAHQQTVGFALETENLQENAKGKLERKNANMIVLNSPSAEGTGFKHDTNRISILDDHNNFKTFELKTKDAVAIDILDYLKTYNS